MLKEPIKKVVLAYSGGLDTSVILRWLQEHYGCRIVAFTADIGQGEEIAPAKEKALAMGVREIFIEDLRHPFVADYVFPMLRANPLYEGVYLLGTAIARPLIAKRQVEIAQETGADSVSHGSTGKGNDQVRFELAYQALDPGLHIIAPWRQWDLDSREKLLDYARRHKIAVDADGDGEAPYSMDANALHISYEGKSLEDPWRAPNEDIFRRSVSVDNAPDQGREIVIRFVRGDPVAVNDKAMAPAVLLDHLNQIAGAHAIGRVDMVENRFVGMKSRGVYETPGASVLTVAHRALESITLDRGAAHLKDEMMPRYAELIYNGFWFSPERLMLQSMIDQSQANVDGEVRLRLHKGNVIVLGRRSPNSLYDRALATFESGGEYDQSDAEGFIRLQGLRLRMLASLEKAK